MPVRRIAAVSPACLFLACCVTVGAVHSLAAAHPIVPGFERFHSPEEDESDAGAGGRLLLGELNCLSCHAAKKDLQTTLLPKRAPILTDVGGRASLAWIREFLTDPQRTKPGTTMPNLFAELPQAERAKRVEALAHFLSTTGTFHPSIPDHAAAARGETLFHQVGCVACHDPRRESGPQAPDSVPLGPLKKKYGVDSLAAFLKDPHQVRPSGRMPNLNLNDKEARDLANYFLKDVDIEPNVRYAYFEGKWGSVPDFSELKPKTTGAAGGFDLNAAPRKNDFGMRFEAFLRIEKDGEYTFFLGSDDGSKLFVAGREVVTVDGIHPYQQRNGKLKLTEGVHPVVVDYIQGGGEWVLTVEYQGGGLSRRPLAGSVSLRPDGVRNSEPPFVADPELIETGRRLFASQGCASCHELREGNERIASELTGKPLAELSSEGGCVAAAPQTGLPHFSLADRQRTALATALAEAKRPAEPLSPEARIATTLTAFNCYACHQRGETGGVTTVRNPFFETTIPEMGDEGRLPPTLTGIGDKFNDGWLKQVLGGGADDRPYMLTRMPKFGTNAVVGLADDFAKLDREDGAPKIEFHRPMNRVKSAGRRIVGEKGLSCIKCHTFGTHKATGIQAIDLTTMTRRLRKDWFQRYMLDPQQYRPGTRMPAAWPRGISMLPDVLDDDAEKQIAGTWTYLEDGPKAPVPLGMIRNAIVLKPEDEPILYRNFIQGVSPRGIGVGYPEQANLAFDAEKLSLGLVWHGPFIDASKHWVGRGPGFQTPLGDHVISLAGGFPFAVLESGGDPWPGDAQERVEARFRGYRLDEDRRPTFLYGSEAFTVADFPVPVPGELDTGFHRTLTVTAPEPIDELWYRAAVGKSIEKSGVGYQVDGALTVRLQGSGSVEPVIRKSGDTTELLLPVRFDDRTATIEQWYTW